MTRHRVERLGWGGEADLSASAETYDPSLPETPVMIDHPKLDVSAYGWVRSVTCAGGKESQGPADLPLPKVVEGRFVPSVNDAPKSRELFAWAEIEATDVPYFAANARQA